MTADAGIYQECTLANLDNIQVGDSANGIPQMVLEVFVPKLNQTYSTVLFFSEGAAPFSFEKLRETGWSAEALPDLKGLGTKKFAFGISYENYTDPKTQQTKQTMKTNIMSGGGRISVSKPTNMATFAAKVALLTGNKSKMPPGAPPVPFG